PPRARDSGRARAANERHGSPGLGATTGGTVPEDTSIDCAGGRKARRIGTRTSRGDVARKTRSGRPTAGGNLPRESGRARSRRWGESSEREMILSRARAEAEWFP